MRRTLIYWLGLACAAAPVLAADWIRADMHTNALVWGARGGLNFAISPAGFRPSEPRGLIRLGYPILTNGGYDLVNFIAVEPIVKGRKGFSELEASQLDHLPGKHFSAPEDRETKGILTTTAPGVEELEVTLSIEKFDNGAHVKVILTQNSASPDELRLTIRTEPDSATMDYCVLTATMGNMARTRQLWLADKTVSSLELYPDYKDINFAPHTTYPLSQLLRTSTGDVIAAITNDEENPMSVRPFGDSEAWRYNGIKVTQYWKKSAGAFHSDLQTAVNARYTYWQSRQPIPGGVAFENFEMREKFYEGQQFTFGITHRTPDALGFKRK